MTTVAIGLEVSASTDMAAIAVAGREGARWTADLMWYGAFDTSTGRIEGAVRALAGR